MVKILNRSTQPSIASRLGQGLATGLSDRFRMLGEQKKLQQQRGDTQAALEALGYEPSIAQRLSALDPQTLRQVISQQQQSQQQVSSQNQRQQAQQQQAAQSDDELKQAMSSVGIPEDAIEEVLPLVKQYPANQRAEFIQEFARKIAENEDISDEEKEQYEQISELTAEESPEQLANMDFSAISDAAQNGPLTVSKFNEMFIDGLRNNRKPNQQPQQQAQEVPEQMVSPEEAQNVKPQAAQEVAQPAPELPALEAVGGRREPVKKKLNVAEILRQPVVKDQEGVILKENEPFLKKIESEKEADQEIYPVLSEMSELLDSGIPTGPLAGRIPGALLSKEADRYDQLTRQIVLKDLGKFKGVRSKYLAELVQSAKINRHQLTDTQASEIKKRARESLDGMLVADFVDQVVQENNGKQPKGLEKSVKDRMKKWNEIRDTADFKNIPPAKSSKGKAIKDEGTGVVLKSNGMYWEPVNLGEL